MVLEKSSLRLRILKENIETLKVSIDKFCNEKNIEPTFSNFISYQEGIVPENYNYIISYTIDDVIVYASKTFYKVVDNLEPDFVFDAFDRNRELRAKIELRDNEELRSIVKEFLGEDMIDVYTTPRK